VGASEPSRSVDLKADFPRLALEANR